MSVVFRVDPNADLLHQLIDNCLFDEGLDQFQYCHRLHQKVSYNCLRAYGMQAQNWLAFLYFERQENCSMTRSCYEVALFPQDRFSLDP